MESLKIIFDIQKDKRCGTKRGLGIKNYLKFNWKNRKMQKKRVVLRR